MIGCDFVGFWMMALSMTYIDRGGTWIIIVAMMATCEEYISAPSLYAP